MQVLLPKYFAVIAIIRYLLDTEIFPFLQILDCIKILFCNQVH